MKTKVRNKINTQRDWSSNLLSTMLQFSRLVTTLQWFSLAICVQSTNCANSEETEMHIYCISSLQLNLAPTDLIACEFERGVERSPFFILCQNWIYDAQLNLE